MLSIENAPSACMADLPGEKHDKVNTSKPRSSYKTVLQYWLTQSLRKLRTEAHWLTAVTIQHKGFTEIEWQLS